MTTATYYMLVCRVCNPDLADDPVIIPFATPAERGRWAMRHKQQTGHDSWLVLDQQPDMDPDIIWGRKAPASLDHHDWLNELFELVPQSWNGDKSDALRYVAHLVGEVKRLGGCLHERCGWDVDEPCDHGYLSAPVRIFGAGSYGPEFF